ncbi:uncharacterized protein LOC144822404 [Lissotriton helveticus]
MSDTDDSEPCTSAMTSKKGKAASSQRKSSEKKSGERYYRTKFDLSWMQAEQYKGIIVPVKTDPYSFRCLICEKIVSCGHQGEFDLKRHISGRVHTSLQGTKIKVNPISGYMSMKSSSEDLLAREAEIKFTGFLAEHNVPSAAADHLGHLIRTCFPDSKIAQGYACGRTKATCVLNDDIAPELLPDLVADMTSSAFSLCVDGSNDQGIEKMNP